MVGYLRLATSVEAGMTDVGSCGLADNDGAQHRGSRITHAERVGLVIDMACCKCSRRS